LHSIRCCLYNTRFFAVVNFSNKSINNIISNHIIYFANLPLINQFIQSIHQFIIIFNFSGRRNQHISFFSHLFLWYIIYVRSYKNVVKNTKYHTTRHNYQFKSITFNLVTYLLRYLLSYLLT
jgi:hypothetical protein